MRAAWYAIVAIVVCSLVPGKRITAQSAGSTPRTTWSTSTGYLGIENLRCNCTFRSTVDESGRLFIFRSEPVVLGVVRGSPADGLLLRGDTIVEMNGYPIVGAEGARRFSNIRPGDEVNLTVRRRGNRVRVSIRAEAFDDRTVYGRVTPEAESRPGFGWEEAPAAPRAPSAPRVARVPPAPRSPETPRAPTAPRVWSEGSPGFTPPATPAVPATPAQPTEPPGAFGGVWAPGVPRSAASPRGWFGFSIRCNNCGWSTESPGQSPIWESDTAPELSMVADGSPASRAGLRAGDRITHIDGVSILSREGARKFGRVVPGQTVRLTIERDRTTLTKPLTLGTRPEVRAAIAAAQPRPATPPARRELRYSGRLDDVAVEVWSAGGPTVEKIGDTMVITVGSSVIRLKVDPKKTQ